MKFTSRKIILPLAAIAVIGAAGVGVAKVSAATDPANPQASLVQKIADTFHLDPTKVQAVFDQNRAANQTARQASYETRLTNAVTAGTLTSAQKDLIEAENTKLQAELTAAGSTMAEKHTAMINVRAEAKAWSAQNNIPEKWLMTGMGGHLRGGMGQSHQAPSASAPEASPAVN